MTQKVNTEIILESDAYKNLAEKFNFTETQIKRFVLGRVAGYSWDRISKSEDLTNIEDYKIKNNYSEEEYNKLSWEEEREIKAGLKKDYLFEKKLSFRSLDKDETFKEMVAKKKGEFGILESSVEAAALIEKLQSIINGEQQGTKMVKVATKDYSSGSLVVTEEYTEVPAYPSVAEQTKATIELHKLTQLDKKTKAKFKLEADKAESEQGNILEKFAKINEMADNAENLEKNKEAEISLEDYNIESNNKEDVEVDENEVIEL